MSDALNFLLENGVSLDEIERLKKQDLSLEEIAGAVRQRLERGERASPKQVKVSISAGFSTWIPLSNTCLKMGFLSATT